MARMFAYIGNRGDLGPQLLARHKDLLRVSASAEKPVGWGVGFYQSGEVLLRRRPIDERSNVDLSSVVEGTRTDILIGHIRRPGIGALRTENTHPFRYRSWLFAQTGTIVGFERLRERLLESQPTFLRRNIRGETDSEMFFYLFLSFLHDAGHLSRSVVAPEAVISALRSSIALVDRLSAEEGHPENSGDVLVTNGEHLFAVHRDNAMAFRVLRGRSDMEELLGPDSSSANRGAHWENSQLTLIVSDPKTTPPDWTAVETGRIVTLTRTDDPIIEAL